MKKSNWSYNSSY